MRSVSNTNCRRHGSWVAALILALVGLAAPAAADDQVSYSATEFVVITGMTRLPGGVQQFDTSLSGNATHLGTYTGTGSSLLDKKGNFTFTGCSTSSNGKDSVCFFISGLNQTTHGSCVSSSTGTYTVTGGTGAFANATGSGTITSQTDACTSTITVTTVYEGTISQPHSD